MWAMVALALTAGREKIPKADVYAATVQGLRVYVTKPAGAKGRLPTLFEVAWLSCDSVEQPNGPEDGFTQLIWDLAAHYATFRVDKPEPCGDLDFEKELAADKIAFAALRELDFVDPARVYIVGFSNGGGVAPLVTDKAAGYLVFSGWYKTWLEHMLEHERRRMGIKLPQAEVTDRMKQYATFYDLYLNGRQTPGAVIAKHPELKPIWYDEPARQYGRPAAFYWQLQSLNLARAWSQVEAPVLAVHGSDDWIMSGDDFALLAAALNARKPGSAEFIEWRGLDHGLYTREKKADPALSEKVLSWLHAQGL
jgi:alpha-beta hydrolase superfamily lysophospholipase